MRETTRVTVTMPVEQAEQLRKLAGEGGAESVSAYVAEAVRHQLNRDRALATLRRLYAERGIEPGAEHHAWARRVLGDPDTDADSDAEAGAL
jgi:Arc/MetJ-type ribon-helix-helix transcriptional regulator